MSLRFANLVSLLFLAAAALHSADTPAQTTQWTVDTQTLGPAQLTGHGSFTPASQLVDDGSTATVSIAADPGYLLAGVDTGSCGGTDNGDGTWTTDTILADCQLSATFVLDPNDVVYQGDFDADIVAFDNVNLSIPYTTLGLSVNWQTGASCAGTAAAPCDNTYHWRPAAGFGPGHPMAFRYPTDLAADTYGVVIDGNSGNSLTMASGDVIGPAQTFDFGDLGAATEWRNGADAYLGFRFLNSNTGVINYGYAHLQTTTPNGTTAAGGFPATVVGFAYNRRGQAITIP